jgi:ABC-type lipoprotein export system ATPase subunit
MLELRSVSRVYRSGEFPVPALQGTSLRVHDGDFLAITGPSGSGKSTLLQVVGCLDRLDFPPARLSGGQRQRVAIARAVANRPRFVLADEPTGALHSEDKARVIALFRQLNRAGHTIVMVTHDPEMAALADHRIEIRDGVLHDAA